jgi:dipeptidyl aminopeptidase/acylaminoacyl peptidase
MRTLKLKSLLQAISFAIVAFVAVNSFSGCQSDSSFSSQQQLEPKAPRIAMKDFFKNPEKTGFRISPDGQFISYLGPSKNRLNVFLQKIGEQNAMQVTFDTVRDIYSYGWKGAHIWYLQDIGGDENFQLFSATLDGKNVKPLTPFKGVRTQIFDDLRLVPGKENEMIIGLNQRNPQYFDPYLINLETGEMKLLYNNKDNYDSWYTDHNGIIRMATKTDGVNVTLLYRANESAPFSELMTTTFKETFSPYLFTFDNKNIYALSNLNGRDKTALVEYDPENKKEVKEIFILTDYDLDEVRYSRKRQVLTSVGYTDWKYQDHFLDKEQEELSKKMHEKFTDAEDVVVYGADDTESNFLVWRGSDKISGKYALYNAATGEATDLADSKPWLKPEDMAAMKPIEYQSRDGLTIHGYLTLPKGYEAKNLPLVVNPHGGPWARDGWYMNSQVQFLANRGYAVFQPNFRGSTGYGRKFWEASFKEWGGTMQDDITDGVKNLIDSGIVDPKRVAIYGGSYGGYATLAGITKDPDLYCCAVDYVGVSNLFTFMNTIPPYWKPYLDMFYEMVGDPKKDSLLLAERSPVMHADRIKCPLFIAQGKNDPRVNKDESDQMVAALKQRGVEVKYMVKDNEGHGFHNEENRFDFYNAMDSFFMKHLQAPADSAKQKNL